MEETGEMEETMRYRHTWAEVIALILLGALVCAFLIAVGAKIASADEERTGRNDSPGSGATRTHDSREAPKPYNPYGDVPPGCPCPVDQMPPSGWVPRDGS